MRLVPFETTRDDGSTTSVWLNPEHVVSVIWDSKERYAIVFTSDGERRGVKGHPEDIVFQLLTGGPSRD